MISNFFSLQEIMNCQLSTYLLNITILLLIIVAIKLILAKNLLETIIIMSIFSLLISLSYLFMDSPDVAMTEVALGACLSTCVLLSFLRILGPLAKYSFKQTRIITTSIICLVFVIVLTWAGFNLPEYGSVDSPLQTKLSKYYIEHTRNDIGIASFVAALLASYRAYDTFGETIVILIAGMAVLLIFSQKNNKHA